MIARVWRGWTAHQNADALEAVLRTQSIPNVMSKNIAGLREAQVLRLERLGETEFIIVLWFDDLDAVRAMTVARGVPEEEYEKAVLSLPARELLRRFDCKVEHYDVREIARL
jgi:heme-degrading monooxygenase HmoA